LPKGLIANLHSAIKATHKSITIVTSFLGIVNRLRHGHAHFGTMTVNKAGPGNGWEGILSTSNGSLVFLTESQKI
jgi:hypothetical protein